MFFILVARASNFGLEFFLKVFFTKVCGCYDLTKSFKTFVYLVFRICIVFILPPNLVDYDTVDRLGSFSIIKFYQIRMIFPEASLPINVKFAFVRLRLTSMHRETERESDFDMYMLWAQKNDIGL